MSIRADSLIPLIQVFILKTANYPGSLQCTGHIAVSTRTSVTLSPAAPDTMFVCHDIRGEVKTLNRTATRLKVKWKYYFEIPENVHVRCWLCDSWSLMYGHQSQVWDIVTAGNLKCPLYPGWCIGISVDRAVCRPLMGHLGQTLASHWPILWWILFTLGTKVKMMSLKNVWAENIHEYLAMKTRMAISQFNSDPVPRPWLFTLCTRVRWITITGGAWH